MFFEYWVAGGGSDFVHGFAFGEDLYLPAYRLSVESYGVAGYGGETQGDNDGMNRSVHGG